MKYIIALILLYSLLNSGCCTSYCAESFDHEMIPTMLFDKNTGDQIQDDAKLNFQFISEANNPSSFDSKKMDLSQAYKNGMKDVLTLKWIECGFCVIAELAVEYEIYGDSPCCKIRSVKVKNMESVCTNPDLEIIRVGGRVTEVRIMVEL